MPEFNPFANLPDDLRKQLIERTDLAVLHLDACTRLQAEGGDPVVLEHLSSITDVVGDADSDVAMATLGLPLQEPLRFSPDEKQVEEAVALAARYLARRHGADAALLLLAQVLASDPRTLVVSSALRLLHERRAVALRLLHPSQSC